MFYFYLADSKTDIFYHIPSLQSILQHFATFPNQYDAIRKKHRS